MFIRVLFVALSLASIFAGVLTAANNGWPPESHGKSPTIQYQSEIISPSL